MNKAFYIQPLRLVPSWVLLIIALSLTAALGVVFYQQHLLKQAISLAHPDYLSMIYLRLLTHIYPEEVSLGFDLARRQRELGYLDQAIETLQPLIARGGVTTAKARYLAIDIQMKQIYMRDSPQENQIAKLQQDLDALRSGDFPLTSEMLEKVAKFCLELNRPDLAAELYIRLAKMMDISSQPPWFAEAGRWYLASGQPDKASEMYYQAFATAQDAALARDYASFALSALRAATLEKQIWALKHVVHSYLGRYPKDHELLEQAIDLALAAGQTQQAFDIGHQRLALDPADSEQISQQLERALAAGELNAALKVAQQGLILQSEDFALRQRVAQIASWAGQPKVALEQLLWLAYRNPTRADLEKALDLARGLMQDSARVQILNLLSQFRPLKPTELQEALDACARIGNVSNGIKFLENYIAYYPKQREAWHQLALAQERAGRPRVAAATWEQIRSRFGWSPKIVRRQSELMWQAGNQLAALALLESNYARVPAKYTSYWEVLGNQAWTLDRVDLAVLSYRTLLKTEQEQASKLAMERLAILARRKGRMAEAIDLLNQAFQRYVEPRLLLLGLDIALQAKRWQDVEHLFKVAEKRKELFHSNKFYWLLRAQTAIHDRRWRKARTAYQRALKIEPWSVPARVGLLWLLIDSGDMQSLARLLTRWQDNAVHNSAYWSVYAIGLTRLGQPKDALIWFHRQAQTKPNDFSLLLSYADVLGQTGRSSAEWRLRQYVLEQIRAEQRDGGTAP